jgi:hypothetical protein
MLQREVHWEASLRGITMDAVLADYAVQTARVD